MRLIKPKVEILDNLNGTDILKRIERVARTCYKSEDKISEDDSSARKLVTNLINSKHEAMLEFVDITVKFTCDRITSQSIVRHRLASYAQESTRYCNYSKDKFGNELTFIIPSWLDIPEGEYQWEDSNPLLTAGASIEEVGYDDSSNLWIKDDSNGRFNEFKRHYDDRESVEDFMESLQKSEEIYFKLLKQSWKPQQARMVLPMSIKTEINMKCNLREWRHFFNLRCSQAAHPDIRVLALDLLKQFHDRIPIIFDDLYDKYVK